MFSFHRLWMLYRHRPVNFVYSVSIMARVAFKTGAHCNLTLDPAIGNLHRCKSFPSQDPKAGVSFFKKPFQSKA